MTTPKKKNLSASSEAYLAKQKEHERQFRADRKRAARLREFGPIDPYKK